MLSCASLGGLRSCWPLPRRISPKVSRSRAAPAARVARGDEPEHASPCAFRAAAWRLLCACIRDCVSYLPSTLATPLRPS